MLSEKWNVTYTWHGADGKWNTASEIIDAENIGQAINIIDEYLVDRMERKGWSDYWIIGAIVVPEMY